MYNIDRYRTDVTGSLTAHLIVNSIFETKGGLNRGEKKTFGNLSEEPKAKLRSCKTQEERQNVLEDADIGLDPEAPGGVSGGYTCRTYIRPVECDT